MNKKLENSKEQKGGMLEWIEKVGNKIPHPFMMFVGLIVILGIISFITNKLGISAVNPANGETVTTKNLISGEGLVYILTSTVKNFSGFAPLGLVLVIALGVGVADETGLLQTVMRKTILGSPTFLITFTIAFIGVCGNVASNAAAATIPPIAAMIFYSTGRNPLAGIALAYAAHSAGFQANVMIAAGTDALLSGITNEASKILGGADISIFSNYFFMAFSTIFLAVIISLISIKIIEPRMGKYKPKNGIGEPIREEITPLENKALKAAGVALLAFIIIMLFLIVPESSILRNPETGSLINKSPFIDGITPLLLLMFLIPAIPFGKIVGTVKSSADVAKYMISGIRGLSSFIALAFIMAQFVAYFNWTNLGTIMAVEGSKLLETTGLVGIPLFIAFILIAAIINIFIGSGSAKWSILAPIFVPMLYLLGYSPALTQMLYRIGDSCTNSISPLALNFVLILGFMNRYDDEAGVGTLVSAMIPYSVITLGAWIVLAIFWFGLGLPLGPGAGLYV